MSDTDPAELTATVDDITVTKTFETEEFPVPAVVFDIRSDRDDTAVLRLVDTVPEEIPSADLGFHPDYGSDHWSVEDGTAVFERRFEPDEEYRTVYGIRSTDADPDAFMTEPRLDVEGSDDTGSTATDDTGSDDAVPGRDTSQAARDVITGSTSVSALSNDDAVEDIEVSGADATEPTGAATASDGESTVGATTDSSGRATNGNVGAALAAELREGSLSESDRELLARELTGQRAGDEVRVSHLQSRISDIEAYTDALEEFIDENGPARQLVEDMTGRLEAVETDLDTLDDRTAENEAAIEALDDRIRKNEDDIDALDKGIADANAEVAETRESVADVRDDVREINDWRDHISSVFGGVPEDEDDS